MLFFFIDKIQNLMILFAKIDFFFPLFLQLFWIEASAGMHSVILKHQHLLSLHKGIKTIWKQ